MARRFRPGQTGTPSHATEMIYYCRVTPLHDLCCLNDVFTFWGIVLSDEIIHFKCPHCGFALRASVAMAGKRGKCKQCGRTIVATEVPVADDSVLSKAESESASKSLIGGHIFVRRLRAFGFAGTGVVAGCIWPLVYFCALVLVSLGLWDALDWPDWILIVGLILLSFGFDAVFVLMLFIAFVVGFFKGAWPWSLAVLGLIAFAVLGNVALGLSFRSFGGADEPLEPVQKSSEEQRL